MNELEPPNSGWATYIDLDVPCTAQYFDCVCHSPEPTLRFVWDDVDNEIYTEVFLTHHQNFFRRCWLAVKYVFGYTCKYGHWDCFIMQSKDARRLKSLLDKLD